MMAVGMDNDTRGWIMCIVSGIACVVGASIIYVDLLVRLFPGQKHFRIQDSNVFLACSLSLSFGVMLFSALYSMLPSSMRYLTKGGVASQAAGFIMMGCFVAGFFGIQIISRVMHQFIPSHVVDCDHTHDENLDEDEPANGHAHAHAGSRSSRSRQRSSLRRMSSHIHTGLPPKLAQVTPHPTESTPLLPTEIEHNGHAIARPDALRDLSTRSEAVLHQHTPNKSASRSRATTQSRRPSMIQVQKRVLSFMKDTKPNCDEYGPCYGYSDPCGQECFKHLGTRSALASRTPTLLRTATGSLYPYQQQTTVFSRVAEDPEDDETISPISPTFRTSRAQSRDPEHRHDEECENHTTHAHLHSENGDAEVDDDHGNDDDDACCSQMDEDLEAQHHHHVPTNAFLSIGLQTVIAIALHKFPEGFITYATNHANPELGFNVFMALFVHNIAEGFALALPLYMALGSRLKAMLWAALLGGLSQPMGAALAVAWFRIAKRSHIEIDNVAYACLFAVTAGIMTSVALQLFVESLSLNHNRNLSIFFAFLGMTLLGVSNVLVKE